METILGFSARLYEVRQLSWRPAQVNARHFFARDSEERHRYRPCQYDQDTTMAGRYVAEVYIRGTVVPLDHSAATLGGGHTSIHQGKKHYQRDQRKNRLL